MTLRDQFARRSRLALLDLLTLDVLPTTQRASLLRRLGATVGQEPELYAGRFIDPQNLTIGDRVFINYECLLESAGPLTINSDVSLGPRVMVLTTTHDVGGPDRRASWTRRRPTVIGSGCWVGAGAMILPGVTVGDGCMVAAGAVVTGDCEPNGLYAGVPARRVRDL